MQPPEGVPHRLPEHWWSPEGNKVSLYIFKAQKMDVKLFNIDPKRNIMCSLNWFSQRKNTGTFHQYFSSRPSDITVKISHHVKIIRNRLTDVPFIIDAPFICCSFTFKLSLISGINISRQVVRPQRRIFCNLLYRDYFH